MKISNDVNTYFDSIFQHDVPKIMRASCGELCSGLAESARTLGFNERCLTPLGHYAILRDKFLDHPCNECSDGMFCMNAVERLELELKRRTDFNYPRYRVPFADACAKIWMNRNRELNRQAVLGVLTVNVPAPMSVNSIAKRVKLKRRIVRAILHSNDFAEEVPYSAVGSGISSPRSLWRAM